MPFKAPANQHIARFPMPTLQSLIFENVACRQLESSSPVQKHDAYDCRPKYWLLGGIYGLQIRTAAHGRLTLQVAQGYASN